MAKSTEKSVAVRGAQSAVVFDPQAGDLISKMFNAQRAAQIGGALWPYVATRGGQWKYGNTALGDSFQGVIIGVAFENRYYEGSFNPNRLSPPVCFAIAPGDGDAAKALESMKPAEGVSDPQSVSCAQCPQNAWGSDPKGGRGKACKNQRRLIVLSRSKDYARAEGVRISVPVTSVKNLANYTKALESVGVPLAAVLTVFTLYPLDNGGFGMDFAWAGERVEDALIGDARQLEAILARAAAGRESLLSAPLLTEDADDQPRGKQGPERIKVDRAAKKSAKKSAKVVGRRKPGSKS